MGITAFCLLEETYYNVQVGKTIMLFLFTLKYFLGGQCLDINYKRYHKIKTNRCC